MDSSQAVRASHTADAGFVTATPTVKPQGNARRGEILKKLSVYTLI